MDRNYVPRLAIEGRRAHGALAPRAELAQGLLREDVAAGPDRDEGALAVGGLEGDGADELGWNRSPVKDSLGPLGGIVLGVGMQAERDQVPETPHVLEVGVGGAGGHLLENGLLVVRVTELAANDGVLERQTRRGAHLPLCAELVGEVAHFVRFLGGRL